MNFKLLWDKVFDYYITNLPKGLQLQEHNKYAIYNYSYFPVVFKSEEMLLKVKKKLNSFDIYPRRYFYPSLDKLPYLMNIKSMPISDSLSKRILCLPMYESLDKIQLSQIIDICKKVLD